MNSPLRYEYPLNERIRSLLRLEFLFGQLADCVQEAGEWAARYALQNLLQVQDLGGRKELRADLLKELERLGTTLRRHSRSPGIDPDALSLTLDEITSASEALQAADGGISEALKRHEFLGAVRQRIFIPGGSCQFDLPILHFWLQLAPATREQQLGEWSAELAPIRHAIEIVLQVLRASAVPKREIAERGFYQQPLEGPTSVQLARLIMPASPALVPELSGNRHRLSVRFLTPGALDQRAEQTSEDVDFRLACCGL